jgi:hypothetical protein
MNNQEPTKVCSKCKVEKPVKQFSKCKARKDSFQYVCKSCVKQYSSEHKEQIKQYFIEHKDKKKTYDKQRHLKNKKERNLKSKKWRLNHKNESKIYNKRYYLKNKKELIKKNIEYQNKKLKNNSIFKIIKNLRNRMNHALRCQGIKKSIHAIDCLGCSAEFYQNYIQSLFKPGMNIDNKDTKKWVQHHIIECNKFNLLDPEQQRKCFHYTNIIPMWENDHIALHAKLNSSF